MVVHIAYKPANAQDSPLSRISWIPLTILTCTTLRESTEAAEKILGLSQLLIKIISLFQSLQLLG